MRWSRWCWRSPRVCSWWTMAATCWAVAWAPWVWPRGCKGGAAVEGTRNGHCSGFKGDTHTHRYNIYIYNYIYMKNDGSNMITLLNSGVLHFFLLIILPVETAIFWGVRCLAQPLRWLPRCWPKRVPSRWFCCPGVASLAAGRTEN